MQRHPEDEQHHDHGADAVADRAVLNGRVFLVGDRNRSGQLDLGLILGRKIQVRGGLADRVGRILAGLQRVVVQDRLEFDEGAAIAIGQGLVARQLAPGERGGALVEDVLDRLRDLVERPLGAIKLDLSALHAGKPGLQRAGQPADRGIAGHDFDQGRGGLELAGELPELVCREEQQAVPVEELAGTERLEGLKVLGIGLQLLFERAACRLHQLRRRRLHHCQDGAVPIERPVELLVALAPVEIGRDQRVDIGVDREVSCCVEARRDRKRECEEQRKCGKSGTASDNRNDNSGQHI